jgi:hypothetical protein
MPEAKTETAPTQPRDWRAAIPVLLLIVAVVAVYGRVVTHAFVWWDDNLTLHHNPRFNPPSGQKILETWRMPVDGLYAPVTYSYWGALAYAAESKQTDADGIHLNARIYHAGSLVLHLASVIVVFSILRLLSRNLWAACLGAILFAVHPIQVETVAWASGAKDLLCGLLGLCAIYLYILFANERRTAKRWFYYTVGAIVLILAMLAKPSAMVVPVIVGVLDLTVLRRGWRKVLPAAAGWAVIILPLVVVARIVQTFYGIPPVVLWKRPLIAADSIAFYISKLLWPAAMAPDYGRRPAIVMNLWGGAWLYVMGAIALAVAVWLWRGRLRRPWLLAAAAIFVVGLGPVLGLTPFMFQYASSVADHYLYLSMLGPAMLATWAIVRFGGKWAVPAGAAIAVALAARSINQLAYWKDDRTLWVHNLQACPDSFNAPNNLAASLGRESDLLGYLAIEAKEAGRPQDVERLQAQRRQVWETAAPLLERAIALDPDYLPARHNAYINYQRLGRIDKAVEHLEALLAANDRRPPAVRLDFTTYHDAAGLLWMRLNRHDKAAEHFERLLAAHPDNASAKKGLAEARGKMREARLDQGP